MTVLTLGFLRHHATPNWGMLQPRSPASAVNCVTLSKFFWVRIFSLSQLHSSRFKRTSSSEEMLYFPVKIPLARGLQMVVPNPTVL